jgi:hypothetical protein
MQTMQHTKKKKEIQFLYFILFIAEPVPCYFSTILYIVLLHSTVDKEYFLENF